MITVSAEGIKMGDEERSLEAPADTSPAIFNTMGRGGGERGRVSGGEAGSSEKLEDSGVITISRKSNRKKKL